MAKLVDFLTALASKGKLKLDDEKIKAFLATEALAAVDVPDEFTEVDKALITIDDAKNNHPIIKPHYTSQSLAPVDKMIENLVTELGFDKDVAAEILGTSSSYQKIPALTKALQAHEGKKNLGSKEATAAFNKQIDELNTAIREHKANAEKAKADYEAQMRDFKLNHEKGSMFSDHKTIYDELPGDVRQMTLINLLNKELQDKGAEITYDDNGSIVLRKKDGTNFYGENNQQVNAKQFVEQVLSKNKLLKVTNSNGQQQQQNGHQQNQVPVNGNGGADNKNTGSQIIKSLNAQALKDAEAAQANMM